jgi:DNA helicase II / ATP-dependent DNA helicase PcrA
MKLEELNDQQKDAVLAEGHVLLTACPGSGKTRVLTHKVAHELQNISGQKKFVIALTFTNRAADEIKHRIVKMDIDLDQLWAGTIHSFCSEWILRPYAAYLDELKNGFVISDEYKSEELLSGLKASYGIDWWIPITTRLLSDGSFAEPVKRYHQVLQDYHDALREEKLIDFDLMLYYAFKLINTYPKIAKTLNNLFHLICVDEYQDTQQLQYAIFSKIINVPSSRTLLFLVGDKDQAIYDSFGGIAKSLEEIKIEFGNIAMDEKELSGNYRSSQRMIDYYRNYQTTSIEIESLSNYATENGIITYNTTIGKDDIYNYIASIIKSNIENGIPENEICVLAPQWQIVIPMGKKLKTLLPAVNFDAIGLSPLLKNRENIWFRFARLFLVDPSPRTYLIRSKWASELIDELDLLGLHILDDFERRSKTLLKTINSIKSDSNDGLTYLKECFEMLLDALRIDIENHPFLNQHWEFFFTSSQKRLDDPTFDYAKDITSFKRSFNQASGVVVNTCHGIKGEEFHTVIAFGLLEGYIPHKNDSNPDNAAKKLLYVICSRSKKHLHLISEDRTRYNEKMNGSRHLSGLNYAYD